MNSTLQIDDRIHLFGGFISGITVWEIDPRAGGRTPDRRQPTGAMQAWIRDGQHEQRQVPGRMPPYASVLGAARDSKLGCLSSPYKPGRGIGRFIETLEGNCNQSDLRCSKGVRNGLICTFYKINTCPECKLRIILHKGRLCIESTLWKSGDGISQSLSLVFFFFFLLIQSGRFLKWENISM